VKRKGTHVFSLVTTDTQRQTGNRQSVTNPEPDRNGEPPIGQAAATAAAQFLTGALGGNQQQVLPYFVYLS
jgi:hypothetical protein